MKKLFLLLTFLFSISCTQEEGCKDDTACNFDSSVELDANNLCIYAEENYDCDGFCLNDIDSDLVCDELEVGGCMDESACNFDSIATDNEGCEYALENYDCGNNCIVEIDCANVCGGDSWESDCGCVSIDNSGNDCDDCAGIPFGPNFMDECGVCDDNPDNDGYEDACGICNNNTEDDCPLIDVDGNVYKYIKIGDQLWMQENLKVTHYRNNDAIPTGFNREDWHSLEIGAYEIYNNDTSNYEIYGNLYNWYTVNDSRGICPEGWGVPEKDDWSILTAQYADTGHFKECTEGDCPNSEYWWPPNSGATNLSGFTGLPGGYRRDSSGPDFDHIGGAGYFWSSTRDDNIDAAWQQQLNFNIVNFNQLNSKGLIAGMSIRCIKD